MKVLLALSGIHKSYGAQIVLDDATVSFCENQKIGVIGRNGAGKSTLCKILTGHEEADGGEIAKSAELRLSYLEQHDPWSLDETVMGFLMRHTGKEEWECGKIAGRFQLKGATLETRLSALSGGFRTRVKLTAMLLAEPNFLILDEPTNYLDLRTLILLEEFLQDYDGAFLIVSHDREFLKKTCEYTLEIERGGCTLYPGTVEEYLVFKEEQKEVALSHNKNVEAKQKQLQEFVDRFRAKASKASQAKSKMKQIEKLKTIEVGHALGNVHIRIPAVERRHGPALRCEDLSIGYPEKLVAGRIYMEIEHGSRVAVLGDNGQGKTTFLRTLAQDLQPKGGMFKWGHGLRVAYYAQHVFTSLRPDLDVYEHLTSMAAPSVTRQEVLNLAGSFLFKGDDVKKKIAVLSGGERARACLAGLLLAKCQVLLLDEPNNHLDFETVEALGRALKTFAGTLFFISHDRTFVNLVATQIVEVQNGSVRLYHGNYEDYVYNLENTLRQEVAEKEAPAAKNGSASGAPKPKLDYHAKKELESEKRKLATRIRKATERIADHKKERETIHEDFTRDPMAWSRERNERYEELARLIQSAEEEWLESTQKLEELQRS
ncbi:MAG TPA: ABC-F family ATP-binding cassette domain-containing protein [Candidatus Eisenbacteria bacterium]|nr:ABC-F family ATP-binding cassette domain-containing protein [Candidatus Eisenbacteria bacterium]